ARAVRTDGAGPEFGLVVSATSALSSAKMRACDPPVAMVTMTSGVYRRNKFGSIGQPEGLESGVPELLVFSGRNGKVGSLKSVRPGSTRLLPRGTGLEITSLTATLMPPLNVGAKAKNSLPRFGTR